MKTSTKIIFTVLTVGLGTAGYYAYRHIVPPKFDVVLWEDVGKTGRFEFGKARVDTSNSNGSYDAGNGWSVQNKGNDVSIFKGGALYKKFAITGYGVVKI